MSFKDFIPLIISTIGLFLSIINSIYLIVINRKNLNVLYIKNLDCSHLLEKSMFLELIFENNSRLKISISRMFLVLDNLKLEFENIPTAVYEETLSSGNVPYSSMTLNSQILPQNIDGLCSIGGFFQIKDFPFEKFYNSNTYTLEIYTSRGLIIKTLPVLKNNN